MKTQVTINILIFIWGFLCSVLCLVAALLISSILKEDAAVMYRWELVRNSGTRTKDSLSSKCVQSREIELNVMRLKWRRKMYVSNERYSTCYVRQTRICTVFHICKLPFGGKNCSQTGQCSHEFGLRSSAASEPRPYHGCHILVLWQHSKYAQNKLELSNTIALAHASIPQQR